MKIKIDKSLVEQIQFEIMVAGAEDVSIIDNYLIIDTETIKQDDFWSAYATEAYQKYFLPNEYKPIRQFYGNRLYEACSIQSGMVLVNESLIDLNYIPPKRSDINWNKINKIDDYKNLPVVCLDIETIDIDPADIEGTYKKGRIILIGIKTNEDEIILKDENEKILLLKLIEYFEFFAVNYDKWVLSGHNNFNFDLTVIYHCCKKHDIKIKMWCADFTKKFTYSTNYDGQPMQYRPIKLYYGNCSIVDTWLLAGAEEKRTSSLSSFGLKDLALSILGKTERRLELDYIEIKRLYLEDNIKPIEEYLLFDIRDQKTLTDYLLPPIYYLKSIVNLSIQDIHYAATAKIWAFLLEEWYKKLINLNLIESEIGLSYQGAFTGKSAGLYLNAGKIDVSSLYPSIMLRYGLCPLNDYQGIFLKILEYILNFRLSIKNSKEPELQYFQLALKILINGGYGFCGTSGYKFNCYYSAALTTAIGRMLLIKMCQTLIDNDIPIIELDTDGIIVNTTNIKIEDAHKIVQNCLPEGISIGIDWQNYSVYMPVAKNYILFKPDGKIKAYGIYKKRNRSILGKEFTIEYIRKYLANKESAQVYYRECLLRIFLGDINYVKTYQRIPSNSKWLLHLGNPGEKVEFYIGEKKKFHKKTGKPCKSEKIAVASNSSENIPMWGEYYIEEIDKIKTKIDEIILNTGKIPFLLEQEDSFFESIDYIEESKYNDNYDNDPF